MEDQRLVREFLVYRSEKAFSKLYQAKTPHLYRIALRLTQSASESEELIQEMWIIAIRKLEGFEWRSELKTWLTGILINLARSKRKARERESVVESEELTAHGEVSDLSFAASHDLEKGIAQLPPGYRQIIILHDIEGYKHREIAELLDVSEGTCKSQLFYARKALRAFLTDEAKKERP